MSNTFTLRISSAEAGLDIETEPSVRQNSDGPEMEMTEEVKGNL